MSPPYSYFPGVNNTCFLCHVIHCTTCQESDPSICLVCNYGFYLDSSSVSQCVPNPNCLSISNVSLGTVGKCTNCSSLHVLDTSTNLCVPCKVAQGCVTCDPTNLTKCTNCGYSFFLYENECKPCPALCSSCNEDGCISYTSEVKKLNDIIILVSCRFPCLSCNFNDPFYCDYC